MKTFVRVGALVAIVTLVACGAHKTSQTASGGATGTQDQSGQQTTVQTKEGTVTVGTSADPAALGAPVYPGANTKDTGAVSISGPNAGSIAAFKTPDDFAKVYDFYKSHLPDGSEKVKLTSGDSSIAEFLVSSAAGDTSVQISNKPGETDIIITHKAKH